MRRLVLPGVAMQLKATLVLAILFLFTVEMLPQIGFQAYRAPENGYWRQVERSRINMQLKVLSLPTNYSAMAVLISRYAQDRPLVWLQERLKITYRELQSYVWGRPELNKYLERHCQSTSPTFKLLVQHCCCHTTLTFAT